MSRVGNSLDNRVVEYFFSILKTEFIYKQDIKSIMLNELKDKVSNYIRYYNETRIKKNLDWMSPKTY